MKKIISLLIIAVVLCSVIIVPVNSSAASSKGVKEEHLNSDKWLSLSKNTTGPRYFVDSKGNPVELFGHHRCQELAASENNVYSAIDGVDALMKVYRDYGANFIRLGIYAPSLCGGEKRTAEEINAYITSSIDPDVQTIIRNGMYVMLDIHMYPPEDCKTAEATVQYARDYYLPILKELAKKYKDEPMVAAIEIWNEPVAADREQNTFNGDVWKKELRQYFIDAVNEIRKIDTRHVLLVSDSNAGWGMEIPSFWGGYYDKVDPVYKNTCFSVHACKTELDVNFNTYKEFWKNLAKDNNICLLFGELETVAGISTEKGIQNLCDFFTETKNEYHFSGALWGSHNKEAGYFDIWADSGWVNSYCGSDPVKKTRYVTEAEDSYGGYSAVAETVKDSALFGTKDTGTGISIRKKISALTYHETTSEAVNNIVYKAGKYKIMVRAFGKTGYLGDFIVGYRDVDGTIHQIARFAGKNTNMQAYYQTFEFTAKKQIASFVFFSCDAKQKSVIIDRIYIESATAEKATSARAKVEIKEAVNMIDINGKTSVLLSALDDTVPSEPSADETSKEPENDKAEDKDKENKEDKNKNKDKEDKTDEKNDSDKDYAVTDTETDSNTSVLTKYIIIALVILGVLVAVGAVGYIILNKRGAFEDSEEDDEESDDIENEKIN